MLESREEITTNLGTFFLFNQLSCTTAFFCCSKQLAIFYKMQTLQAKTNIYRHDVLWTHQLAL